MTNDGRRSITTFPGDASRNTHDAVRIRVQEQTVDAEDAAAKEQSRATKRRDEKKSRDKRAALEKKNAALVISQAQEITSPKEEINRLKTTTPLPPLSRKQLQWPSPLI